MKKVSFYEVVSSIILHIPNSNCFVSLFSRVVTYKTAKAAHIEDLNFRQKVRLRLIHE